MKSCRRYGWVVVASTVLAPSAPATAEEGGVVGWVESTRGVPLAGAVISIFGKSIHGNRIAMSDSRGQFVLPALPPGSYTLRAVSSGHEPSAVERITVLPNRDALFTVSLAPVAENAGDAADDAESERQAALKDWLWLMRHKRRSVLETETHVSEVRPEAQGSLAGEPAAASLSDVLPLTGNLELAASSGAAAANDSVGALRLRGRLADGVAWSLGGLVAENEGRAWRVAAQFVIDPGAGHDIEAGAGYGAGDTRLLFANGELQPDRTSGSLFLKDRWRVSDHVTATAGGRYTYVGFLADSHHADAVVQIELEGSPGTVVRGSIATRALVPGGDMLTLSTVAASPAITWARLDEGLRTSRVSRYDVGFDRAIGASRLGAQLFDERAADMLLTSFDSSGLPVMENRGEAEARGFAVTLGHRFGSVVNGSVTYSFGRVQHAWSPAPIASAPGDAAAFHDVVARLETVIDGTSTRFAALYRLNAISADEAHGAAAPPCSRFDVQLTQGLPFLQPLTRADWELLVAVRNMFYEASQAGFLDELAVQEPPTRVVGGISVRF